MSNQAFIIAKIDDQTLNDYLVIKIIDNGDGTRSIRFVDQNNPGLPAVASGIADSGDSLLVSSAPFSDTTPIVKGSADATKLLRFEVDGFTAGATRVLTPPDADGVLVLLTLAQFLSNKQLEDSTTTIVDNTDNTKAARFEASGITAGQTRVITIPDSDGTLVFLTLAQVVSNKTLASPRITTAILDNNGNEVLLISPTASAVNEVTIANAATGNAPAISASGDDANVGINLTPKGTGNVVLTANKYIAPAVLNTGGLFFAGDTTTGYSWRSANILAIVNNNQESVRISTTSFALQSRTLDQNGANGTQIISNIGSGELLTLNTGGTTTTTAGNLAPANAIIEAILIRVITAITTAANFAVRVTGASADFVMIGTATSSLTNLVAGATYVLVPSVFADMFNDTATTLTVTTNVNPGAGAVRLFVVYKQLVPPSS
jgi:hypothetical protein